MFSSQKAVQMYKYILQSFMFKGTIGNFGLLMIKRGIAATNTLKPPHCEHADVETPNRFSWKQQQLTKMRPMCSVQPFLSPITFTRCTLPYC